MEMNRRSITTTFIASMMLGFFVLGPLVKYATRAENGKFMARPGMRGAGAIGEARFAAVQAQFRPPEANTESINRARNQYGAITKDVEEISPQELARRRAIGDKIMGEHEAELKRQGRTAGGGDVGNRLSDIIGKDEQGSTGGFNPAPAPQQGFNPAPQQGFNPAPAPAPQQGFNPAPRQGFNPAPAPAPQQGFNPARQGFNPAPARQGFNPAGQTSSGSTGQKMGAAGSSTSDSMLR